MTEKLVCVDCGKQANVHCGNGVYSCLACVNVHIRANNAQHEAQQTYEAFLDRGGRVN
jgi:ribosomal protein L37AE/L43A